MPPLSEILLLVPVGLGVGIIGSLIGVGGGFFVVPFLMLAWGLSPTEATAASLGTVFLNACSASTANARRRRADYRTGLALAAGSIPGAWTARVVSGTFTGDAFSWAFGILLLGVAAHILFVKVREGKGMAGGRPRELTDSDGHVHRYRTRPLLAFGAGLLVGFIASLFGIGGGLLLVPFMVTAFGMPILVASATAQFTFIFTSLTGLSVAAYRGQVTSTGVEVMVLLGAGVVVGAQVGVAVAKKINPKVIRLLLAGVMVGAAVLMIRQGLSK